MGEDCRNVYVIISCVWELRVIEGWGRLFWVKGVGEFGRFGGFCILL